MPNYAYNNSIPLATDDPSISQGELKTNCESVNDILDQDLYGFQQNNGGLHRKSTYVLQTVDPTPANADGAQCIAYSKTPTTIAELFVTRYGSATPVQMTNGSINITGNATGTSKGHSFLPGGMLIQWGSLTASTGGVAFTFDVSFTTIYSIVGAIQATGAQSMAFASVSASGATVYSQSGSQQINYIAIGV